jgi:hypothetical protein
MRGAVFGCCYPAGAAGVGAEGGESFEVDEFHFVVALSRIRGRLIPPDLLFFVANNLPITGVRIVSSTNRR